MRTKNILNTLGFRKRFQVIASQNFGEKYYWRLLWRSQRWPTISLIFWYPILKDVKAEVGDFKHDETEAKDLWEDQLEFPTAMKNNSSGVDSLSLSHVAESNNWFIRVIFFWRKKKKFSERWVMSVQVSIPDVESWGLGQRRFWCYSGSSAYGGRRIPNFKVYCVIVSFSPSYSFLILNFFEFFIGLSFSPLKKQGSHPVSDLVHFCNGG